MKWKKKEFGILTKWIKNIENDILYRNIESQAEQKKQGQIFAGKLNQIILNL